MTKENAAISNPSSSVKSAEKSSETVVLLESEERFRLVLDASPDGFIILRSVRDASGAIADFTIEYANPVAAVGLESTPEQVVGLCLSQLFSDCKTSGIFERYVAVTETGISTTFETFYDRKTLSGWFRHVVVKSNDGIAVSFSNITDSHILESITDAFIAFDHDWRYTYVNQEAARMLGRSPQELLGRHWQDVFPEIAQQDTAARRAFHKAMEEHVTVRLETFSLATRCWIEMSVFPSSNGVALSFHDISDRKRVEAERKRTEQRREAQYAIARILTEVTTVDEAAAAILPALCENLDWQVGVIWNVDPDRTALRSVNCWQSPNGETQAFVAATQQLILTQDLTQNTDTQNTDTQNTNTPNTQNTNTQNADLPRQVWSSHQPIWVAKLDETSSSRSTLAVQSGLQSAFGFPIQLGDEILGVIECFSSQVQEPDSDVLQMMTAIGSQIGQFMERKRTETALRESQELFQSFMNHSPIAAFIKDETGRYLYANPSIERVYQRSQAEIIGKTDFELLPAAIAQQFYANDVTVLTSGQPIQMLETIQHEDGEHSYMSLKFPFRHADGKQVLAGVAIDVSARIQAEAALRQREAELRLITNAVPVLISFVDAEQRYRFTNQKYEEWFGRPASEVNNKHIWDVLGEEAYKAIRPYVEQVLAGKEVTFESRIPYRDGGTRDVVATYVPRFDQQRNVEGFVALVNDVTDRKQTEAALHESEARFQALVRHVPGMLYRYISCPDGSDAFSYVSSGSYELLELEPDAITQDASSIWQLFHPDDLPALRESVAVVVENSLSWQWEGRLITPSGQLKWIQGRSRPEQTEQGNIWNGVLIDITERKQAEEALRKSEERFQLIAKATNDVMWDYNLSTNEMWWSERLHTVFGYQPEEMEPDMSGWTERLHPEDAARVHANYETCLDSGATVWTDAYRFRRANGSYADVLDRAYIIRDSAGSPVRIVGAMADVTKQQQAEQALRHSEEWARLAIQVGRLGGWRLHLDTNLVEMDERMREIWGELNDAVMIALPRVLKRIHPDDRDRVASAVSAAIAPQSSGTYETDYRIVWDDGTVRWVLAKGQAQFEGKGESRQTVDFFGTLFDITDRKLAEAALAEQEQRYRYIFEAVSIAIWEEDFSDVKVAIDQLKAAGVQDFRQYFVEHPEFVHQASEMVGLRDVNQAALRMFGTSDKTELLTSLHQIFVPETQEAFIGELLAIAAGEPFFAAETVLRTLKGDRFDAWFMITWPPASKPYDRVLISLIDISDRKRAEAALRDSAEQLNLALTAAKLGNWSWQVATDIVTFSEQAAAMFGIPPGPYMTSTQMQELLHPDDREQARLQVEQAIVEHSDYDVEYRVIHPNGTTRWVAAKGRAQHDSVGQVLGMIGVVQDITHRKQAEVEREQLLAREQVARSQAEQANRIKDEFLAVLSHELRSPLNPILGWAKLLQTRQFDESGTKRALETIERNAKLQTQLIDDLLDVSRILQGKMMLNVYPIHLMTVIDAALETVRLSAEAKGIKIQKILASNIGLISGDSARLQQIVWNLLSNAVKFTPNAGHIEIRLEQVGAEVQIQVKDTGKGIAPEFLPHVFEYFRQEDGTTTRKFGGLGLGLAIVRYLTELHGGTVKAESSTAGATFTVSLPVSNHENGGNSNQPGASSVTDVSPLANLRILIVDDEADMRELILAILEPTGADIKAAASAAEALKALNIFRPDVLISDIGMPDMDGYRLMRQVRSLLPSGRQIPAIALTAYAGEIDQQQALAAGFQQHIAKPVEPEDLIKAIVAVVTQ